MEKSEVRCVFCSC